jgi:hypothetical protein
MCPITNVGSNPITVTIQAIGFLGGVLNTDSFTVPSGASRAIFSSVNPGVAYCKFIGAFTRGSVRANAHVWEQWHGDLGCSCRSRG